MNIGRLGFCLRGRKSILTSAITPFGPSSIWEKKKRETSVGLEQLLHLFMHKLYPPLYINQRLITSLLNFPPFAHLSTHTAFISLSLTRPHICYHTHHVHITYNTWKRDSKLVCNEGFKIHSSLMLINGAQQTCRSTRSISKCKSGTQILHIIFITSQFCSKLVKNALISAKEKTIIDHPFNRQYTIHPIINQHKPTSQIDVCF